MWFSKYFNSLTSTSRPRRPTRRPPPASRLRFEPLEERRLLAFDLAVDYGSELAAQSVVSGDFNGDGRLDLATGNRDEHTVSVLLGNGDGTFQAARTSGADFFPTTLAAADLNGDGKDDLLTRNISPNYMSVRLGNGDGTFQPPQDITLVAQVPSGIPEIGPLEQTALEVAIGDFNGDGKLDLVAGGQTVYITGDEYYQEWYVDDYANVLLGNGDGTFHLAAVKHMLGRISPVAGDFNNDGQLDILTSHGVLPGNGDGTLQDLVPTYYVTLDSVTNPVGDFNGDGNLDVLSDFQTGPFLQLGNGDGTFQQGKSIDLTGLWHSTAAGDVNADGKLDIVVVQAEQESSYDEYGYPYVSASIVSARVLLGHGDGTFEPIHSDLGTVPGLSEFVSPVLADFDSDGFPDLAAIERNYTDPYGYGSETIFRGVHVSLNDGTWTLPPPPPPTINISDVTVTEGNTGTRAASLTVTLSAAHGQPVIVSYATADGTAAAGSDYQAAFGTLTIPVGQTTGTITVLVNGDRLGEANETFFVNLSSPTSATIADGQGVGTILDNEPRISISDVSKAEGKKGQTTLFTFTVTLSAAYDQPVTMSYRTANGTATTGNNDYVAKTGTLTFAPGETSKTITIEIKGDSKREANDVFYLDLFGLSSNAMFTKNRGLGTILNDD